MRLANSLPAFAGHPEIRSYRCDSCGEVRATVIDLGTLRERPIAISESQSNGPTHGGSGKATLSSLFRFSRQMQQM
jgi:hypothetical protein